MLKRQVQQAWDVAFAWLREEPPVHHTAMPWQILLALISTAFCWGWIEEAGVLALAWGGLLRIGEVFAARRQDLLLPRDFGFTIDYALLRIGEPKTRFKAARHQCAKVDHPQLLLVIEVAFFNKRKDDLLWKFSAQTMRSRLQRLLKGIQLGYLDGIPRGLDLGSLRAGGASWLLMTSEDSELTRRRGRWISSKVMEIYVQEIASVQFLHRLPNRARDLILQGVSIFPDLLESVHWLWMNGMPMNGWRMLLGAPMISKDCVGQNWERSDWLTTAL